MVYRFNNRPKFEFVLLNMIVSMSMTLTWINNKHPISFCARGRIQFNTIIELGFRVSNSSTHLMIPIKTNSVEHMGFARSLVPISNQNTFGFSDSGTSPFWILHSKCSIFKRLERASARNALGFILFML